MIDAIHAPRYVVVGEIAAPVVANVRLLTADGIQQANCPRKNYSFIFGVDRKRQHLVPNCQRILKALAKTGEVALIDEATGYQYHRAPDALQALISRLLRERVASWARRFSPDYYRALFRLFGWHYQGHQQNPPAVIGQITLRWVYDVIMPREIIEEIRNRKRLSDKAHQWLSEGGLALLEKQIHAVTMIARSSMTYRDFDTRCATAFGSQPLQMTLFIGALEGGQ